MTRLARVNWKNGSIYVNPEISGEARVRVMRHMKTFVKLRKEDVPRNKAILLARKVEHRGMSQHQISVYEGKLSVIARRRK